MLEAGEDLELICAKFMVCYLCMPELRALGQGTGVGSCQITPSNHQKNCALNTYLAICMNCICMLLKVFSVGLSFANVCYRMEVPRWIVALVTLLTWFEGMALASTPDVPALLEVKEGLTTTSPLLEGWNTFDPSPCSWGGINCTESRLVLYITLINQVPKLKGHLSSSLGKLKLLERLWLDGNLLSGSIPPEIGNLSNVRNLSLLFENFYGEIPLHRMTRDLEEELDELIWEGLKKLKNSSRTGAHEAEYARIADALNAQKTIIMEKFVQSEDLFEMMAKNLQPCPHPSRSSQVD